LTRRSPEPLIRVCENCSVIHDPLSISFPSMLTLPLPGLTLPRKMTRRKSHILVRIIVTRDY
jgi:hypothetical protein